MSIWTDILRVLGVDNEASRWYAFWSGFGGDIPIVAGIFVFYRHHNCHERLCWRPGHVQPDGRVICRRHHTTKGGA